MDYVSTRNSSNNFKFKDVFIKSLADDGGLYIPKSLHKYNQKNLDSVGKYLMKAIKNNYLQELSILQERKLLVEELRTLRQ